MITVVEGDLFQSETQTIVNTINCVGAMGKGIALEYKKRYPDMYEKCDSESLVKNLKIYIMDMNNKNNLRI